MDKFILLSLVGLGIATAKSQINYQLDSVNRLDSIPIVIKGRIEGGNSFHDTIKLAYLKVDTYAATVGAERRELITNDKGEFGCSLSGIHNPGRLNLILCGYSNIYANIYESLEGYIVEPGDSVFIIIKRTEGKLIYIFSGRGATKYQCRKEIDIEKKQIDSAIGKERQSQAFWDIENWGRRKIYADSIIKIEMKIVNLFKKDITSVTYRILQADIIGEIENDYLVNFYIQEYIDKNEVQNHNLYQQFLSLQVDTTQSNILAFSPNYIHYLILSSLLHLYIEKGCNNNYNLPTVYSKGIKEWYFHLKNDYCGPLRDMALISLLTDNRIGNNGTDYDDCLKDALTTIETQYIKETAKRWFGVKSKGSIAYNFALSDTSGKIIHLSDFLCKIVLIDIWFTGCGGCREWAKEAEKNLYPKFKNNANIIFVSISGDQNKNKWLQSVRAEKYSRKENINLYTDGLGFNHPFMKFYDFYGGPYLMLIDRNSRIYSCAPPRDANELADLIFKVLGEKNKLVNK